MRARWKQREALEGVNQEITGSIFSASLIPLVLHNYDEIENCSIITRKWEKKQTKVE